MIQAPARSAPRGDDSGRASSLRRQRHDPLVQAFARLARRQPLAPLVLSGNRRATVADVDSLALAARHGLERHAPRTAKAGLPPGALVAVAAQSGPGFLASLLAVRRAGAAAVLLDGQAPPAEALRVARALGASALLRCLISWPAAGDDWETSWLPGAGSEGAVCLPGIAVVKLTSGSTGAPRGIATPAAALLADDAALARTMGLRAGDTLLAAVPMSHSYGLSSLAIPALVRGTPLVMPDDSGLCGPFDAAERLGATVLPTVPPYLDALLRLSQVPGRPRHLRLVIAAGAPLSAATAAAFREVYGLPVHVFYGASECGGICYDREGGAAERGSVGSPVDGVEIQLLPGPGAAEGGHAGPAGGGHAGAVAVRSAAVAAGYVPDPDLHLAGGRFVAGDHGTWRQGELVLLGRHDEMINIKGKKVNPREVESVLAELAGVDEVAVLGVPMPDRGSEVLRAVIACRPGRLTRDEVIAWCRERLAAHKIPRSLLLLAEIPRTARGKLDRAALLSARCSELAAGEPPPGGRRDR
ncbi:MAG TPA: fatty acid--CoA ligase family protein [Thermoanaerobaculia bacterium]|nr:fatty acid--CoA ligase family protein [Thermoanaerobaculia bacterium]